MFPLHLPPLDGPAGPRQLLQYSVRMAPHHHHNAHVTAFSSHLDHGPSVEQETPHEGRRSCAQTQSLGGGAGGQLFYNDCDYPPYLQQFHFHDPLASFCIPKVNRELCACPRHSSWNHQQPTRQISLYLCHRERHSVQGMRNCFATAECDF